MILAKAYYKGFTAATRTPRMLLLIYVTNLILGLIVAIPFYRAMQDGAGNAISLNRLLDDFDFTVLADLSRNASEALKAINTQTITVGAVYFILSVFFIGGILKIAEDKKYTVSTFFKYSSIGFFRNLLLNAVMLVAHALWLGIAFLLAFIANKIAGPRATSEWLLFYVNGGLLILYALGGMFILMVSDYGKFFMHKRKSHNFLKGSWKGLGFVIRHFGKTYTLFLLLIAAPVAVFLLYFWIEAKIEMSSFVGLLLLFLLQQAFIFSRIWFRVWILDSQFLMYLDDSEKDRQKKLARRERKKQQQKEKKAETQPPDMPEQA